MSRVDFNEASLRALQALRGNQAGLTRTLERLSTGYRINRASDDPAGQVVTARLQYQIQALRQAVERSQNAQNVLNTADAALTEVNALLVSARALALEAASGGALSDEEVQANQAQIDSAIDTINRIAATTKFGGQKLLDGSLGYTASGVAASVADLHILGAVFGTASQIPVDVTVTQSAQHAFVTRSGKGVSAASSITLEITGTKGTVTLTLGASAANSQIKAAINAHALETGVSAITSTTVSGGLFFYSTGKGSDAFVSVRDLDLDGNNSLFINKRDEGRDAAATVNGIAATARGADLEVTSAGLKLRLSLSSGLNKNNVSTTFVIVSGGLSFQLGDTTTSAEQTDLGIQSVSASRLGNTADGTLNQVATGQAYDLRGDPSRALRILDAALGDIQDLRSRLGAAVAHTFETNTRSLSEAVENLEASHSRLKDSDFAAEAAELAKFQILTQAGTSILAQANLVPQQVLELLRR